jgi:hypothetical protein
MELRGIKTIQMEKREVKIVGCCAAKQG